ncbi:MAG: dipeptidase [Acidimicrobiia bacterium]
MIDREAPPSLGIKRVCLAVLIGAVGSCEPAGEEVKVGQSERAAAIRARAILVDGHNDLPWRVRSEFDSSFDLLDIGARRADGHTDIPRLREGGVGAQFFAAYVPVDYIERGAARVALEQIDLIHRMAARYPDLEMAYGAHDVRRVVGSGKIAVLIGIEGGHAIENSLGALRMFYDLGVRYMTLTHGSTIDWADAATDEERHGGLTAFGEQVVREMNRLGMLVDISHVSAETMRDVLRVTEAPVIASHSCARAIADHPRNVPDDVLRMLASNGGVIMVNFYSGFVVPEAAPIVQDMFGVRRRLRAEHRGDEAAFERAWTEWQAANPIPRGGVGHVVDHIDHIVQVAGVDHVGLGSDYDGVTQLPEGLEDVSKFPTITEELIRRGYSDGDILKILGDNTLRALGAAEDAASRLQGSGP